MKKYLTILFICLLQNTFAGVPYYVANNDGLPNYLNTWKAVSQPSYTGIIHYIDPTGSDATGDGTIGSPWKSLAYACTQVTTPGDTIFVNAGTYTETLPAILAVGVSIRGVDSASTHIKSDYQADWNSHNPSEAAITLVSTTEGTNGNQSISNLTLDGDNRTGINAILIRCRGGVLIHDIHIKDFYVNGIDWQGSSVSPYTHPSSYAVGNRLYNSSIDNSTDTAETNVSGGLMTMAGQKDLWIYNCSFADTSRGAGANGDIIIGNRYGLGFKYFNNKSYKPSTGNDGWNFHLEIPSESAGAEAYGNEFYGGDCALDIGDNIPDEDQYDFSYPFSYSVHDNYIEGKNTTSEGTHGKCAVSIEGEIVRNVFVYRNTFKNVARPFGITDGTSSTRFASDSNVQIYSNVSYNTGITAASTFMNLIELTKSVSGGSMRDIIVANNTVLPNTTVFSTAVKIVNNGCTMKNIVFANNILPNGNNGYWFNVDNTGGTFDSLIIRNNNTHNSPNSSAVNFSGNPVTHYINSGNISSDPLLVSSTDYHLQSGSPAIGAAYPYGYGVDIGALQYTSTAPIISMSADQNITTSGTSISAVGTPYTGHTITGYSWTRTQGTGTISNPNSASTPITGMNNGINKFQCTVTQDDGQTASGIVTITVNIPSNVPPSANAGTDQTITLPTSSITLSGSGTDSDGSIASYSWSKVSGGIATITSATSSATAVTGLAAGVYVFRLTVTDNQGATGYDDVQVTVNNPATPNAYIKLRVPTKFINK